jgi:4-amino-4-deoxy-L-arabinose transferase-like glycosyltransferase
VILNIARLRGRRAFVVAAVALALMWCAGLFGRGYWTPDEPREAALASSMAAHLQPLPSLAGRPFAEKPPLTYWLASLAQRGFGAGPAISRLPQLGYAVLALLAVLALARRLLAAGPGARDAAFVTALVFASGMLACQVQVWLGTDALLLAGVCLALEGMHAGLSAASAGASAQRRRLGGYLRMHVGLALAFFAKGFAGWLVPVLALLCFAAWERRWRELLRWELLAGGVLLAAAIMAWVSAVAAQPDGAHSLRVLFRDNIVGRALPIADASGENYSNGHPNWPGKYLLDLPVCLFPWTFLAFSALPSAWRTMRGTGGSSDAATRTARRFAVCATLPGLVFLSLAATARSIYVAPCLPGFALLTGLWIGGAGDTDAKRRPWSVLATRCAIALSALVVIALTLALQWTVERSSPAIFLASLIAGMLALGWAVSAREVPALAAAWCLLLAIGTLSLLRAVDRTQDIAALAKHVAGSAGPEPVVFWNPDETTLAWAQLYLPGKSWSAIDEADVDAAGKLAHTLQAAPGTVVVSLVRGRAWSAAKWGDYLRPRAVTAAVTMLPPSQAAREPLLAAERFSVTTRIERPGGRGYLLWRRRGSRQ